MEKAYETVNSVRKNQKEIKENDKYAICLCVYDAFLCE